MRDLIARIRAEQRRQWESGSRVRVEALLPGHPELADAPEAVLDLIYAEVLLREEFGEDPAAAEYASRFPQYAAELARQFEVHVALRDAPTGPESTSTPLPMDRPMRPVVPGYEVGREIGRGAWGVVYEARQLSLDGRRVAVKIVRPDRVPGAARAALRRDAEAAARLDHPSIARVIDCGEHLGALYVVLELVEGGTLAGRLAAGPLPPTEAARVAEAVARAVHHAHIAGIVHRDLKPANVLLTPDGAPKVADFGLAKRLDGVSSVAPEGAIVGTWQYMAPEQAAGATRDVGPPADVWAVGVLLHEMLTGRRPFDSPDPVELLRQVRDEDPPAVARRVAPRDLDVIRRKCLRKEAAHRYPTAAALADDLGRFLASEPVLARDRPWPARLWRRARRRPLAVATAASFLWGAAVVIILQPGSNAPLAPNDAGRSGNVRLPVSADAGPVTLKGFTSEPDGIKWPVTAGGAPGCRAKQGNLSIAAVGDALFEVAQDPGCDHYRYSVRLRHDDAGQDSWIGLYFGYQEAANDGRRQGAFFTLGFADRGNGFGATEPGHVRLQVHTFADAAAEQQRIDDGSVSHKPMEFQRAPALVEQAPWRELAIEVGPDRVKATFKESPDVPKEVFVELTDKNLEDALKRRRDAPPRRPQVGFTVPPRSRLGVYVSRGSVSVSEISITKIN